ncbi:MAG: Cell division protein ftsA [Parcubacteria group bacterium Gr01-1014_33]|nr:MAG: Cell division protein ftsA [Parcubacteria group bacterium Gr01-1014_33]
MARNIITSLDVGTSTIQVVVAERMSGEANPRILGMGMVNSAGVRRGAIVDLDDATGAIRAAVEEARRSSGVPIRSVWVATGGPHATISSSRGVVAVSRADGEISQEDVRRAIAAAETFIPKNANREILHIIPRDFRVDHEAGVKDPVGMHGVRLEVDTLIIECSTPVLKNLFKCIEAAGLRIEDYVFSPLAAAEMALTKRQKELGVMLLDLGGGTASFIVFEEGMPLHAGVFPIGGNQITNDVAIGFRTHVDTAEQIKCAYGSCGPAQFTKKDVIRLAEFVPEEQTVLGRRELAEIIEARLGDIFELLQKELKKIGRKELLPGGVVLVGGSSLIPGVVELTRYEIGLPVQCGFPEILPEVDEKIRASFIVALGTIQWAYSKTSGDYVGWANHFSHIGQSGWVKWLKSLLP